MKPTHKKIELTKSVTAYVPINLHQKGWDEISIQLVKLALYEKHNTLVNYVPYCAKCLQEVSIGLGYTVNRCKCPKNTKSKYNNKKIRFGKNVFDSKAEARRYISLVTAHVTEEILFLELQPTFQIPSGVYRADFQYQIYDEEDQPWLVIEDVKGVRTAVYNLKRKMFLAANPGIIFLEVGARPKSSKSGWRSFRPKS